MAPMLPKRCHNNNSEACGVVLGLLGGLLTMAAAHLHNNGLSTIEIGCTLFGRPVRRKYDEANRVSVRYLRDAGQKLNGAWFLWARSKKDYDILSGIHISFVVFAHTQRNICISTSFIVVDVLISFCREDRNTSWRFDFLIIYLAAEIHVKDKRYWICYYAGYMRPIC